MITLYIRHQDDKRLQRVHYTLYFIWKNIQIDRELGQNEEVGSELAPVTKECIWSMAKTMSVFNLPLEIPDT